MKVFEVMKFGSNLLKENKIPSHILDSELLLSKVLKKSREEILINLDNKIDKKKISILARLRNYFLAGIVVLVPIGFTLYLTIFLIKISSKLLPNEINPNNYLPFRYQA